MYDLPVELINYCLYLANTGTKIKYIISKKKYEIIIDKYSCKYEIIQKKNKEIEIYFEKNINNAFFYRIIIFLPRTMA